MNKHVTNTPDVDSLTEKLAMGNTAPISYYQQLNDAYCYHQPDVQPDSTYPEHKNVAPPNEINITDPTPRFFLCGHGHFDKTSPRRYLESGCAGCKRAGATSIPECVTFEYLSVVLADTHTVEHSVWFEGRETDILVTENETLAQTGLEIDGLYGHQDRVEIDREKVQSLLSRSINAINLRDERLQRLNAGGVEFTIKELKDSWIRTNESNFGQFSDVLIQIAQSIDPNATTYPLSQDIYDAGVCRYYERCSTDPANSAAAVAPHLVNELDNSKTGVDLNKVSRGSTIKLPFICPDCSHPYTAAVAKRTGVNPTNCPSCNGTKATPENNLCVHYAEVAEQLVNKNGTDYLPGSGAKENFRCGHPGCNETDFLQVKDRVRSFSIHGHTWLAKCGHPGYLNYSVARRQAITAQMTARHQNTRNTLLAYGINPTVLQALSQTEIDALSAPAHDGVTCPDCMLPHGVGQTLNSRFADVNAFGCLQCWHCLRTGIPLTTGFGNDAVRYTQVIKDNFSKAKQCASDLVKNGLELNKSHNLWGLSLEQKSKNVSLVITAKHPNGGFETHILAKWPVKLAQILSNAHHGVYSSGFRAVTEFQRNMARTFPNLQSINPHPTIPGGFVVDTGNSTVINGTTIDHPPIVLMEKKMVPSLYTFDPQHAHKICPCMALVEREINGNAVLIPSHQKLLGYAEFMLKLTAANNGITTPIGVRLVQTPDTQHVNPWTHAPNLEPLQTAKPKAGSTIHYRYMIEVYNSLTNKAAPLAYLDNLKGTKGLSKIKKV